LYGPNIGFAVDFAEGLVKKALVVTSG
jgi:hypothetical protein